jgi:hypothetical protein
VIDTQQFVECSEYQNSRPSVSNYHACHVPPFLHRLLLGLLPQRSATESLERSIHPASTDPLPHTLSHLSDPPTRQILQYSNGCISFTARTFFHVFHPRAIDDATRMYSVSRHFSSLSVTRKRTQIRAYFSCVSLLYSSIQSFIRSAAYAEQETGAVVLLKKIFKFQEEDRPQGTARQTTLIRSMRLIS